MKKILITFFVLMSFCFGFDKIAVGYGQDSDNSNVYNIAIQKDIDYKLIDNTELSFEISADFVDGKSNDLFIISVQPMLSYDINESFYIEAGVGIAYFSEKELNDRRFGTNFQFKESIGFGYKFNKEIESTLKYVHYSNADLNKENSGLDMVMLQVVYTF